MDKKTEIEFILDNQEEFMYFYNGYDQDTKIKIYLSILDKYYSYQPYDDWVEINISILNFLTTQFKDILDIIKIDIEHTARITTDNNLLQDLFDKINNKKSSNKIKYNKRTLIYD